ncbi:MAG: hypothetical protein AB1793_04595 [Candidatus Thermoplasmatota archaeon]
MVVGGRLAGLNEELRQSNQDIQDLETHREIWMSLLKGLPTVIIVVLVALLTSLAYAPEGEPFRQIAVVASALTFFSMIMLWCSALWCTLSADRKAVSLRNRASVLRQEDGKLSAAAQEAFVKYKTSMMPSTVVRIRAGNLRFEDGKIPEGLVTAWRKHITPDRQKDMQYLDGNLVNMMDELEKESVSFIRNFNDFATEAYEIAKGVDVERTKPDDQTEIVRSVVFTMYKHLTEHQSQSPQKDYFNTLIWGGDRPFVISNLDGKKIRVPGLVTALHSEELRGKALAASAYLESASNLYDRILVDLRYKYSAE